LGAFSLAVLLSLLLSPGFRRAASAIPAADPAAGLDEGRGDSLRYELSGLKGRYLDALLACRPEEPELPADGEPLSLPDPERAGGPPPAAGDAPLALEAAANRPKDGDSLVIPEGATDLAFLEGCWRTEEAKSEFGRGTFYYEMCFDSKGSADAVGFVDDGGGTRCRGKATAALADGNLVFRTRDAYCPGVNITLLGRTIRCSPAPGAEARCEISHPRGKTHSVKIVRKGE
jgi:hypothetical protein